MYSGYTVYHQVNEEVELALQTIINNAADSPGEPGSESQQVGDVFSSFMDVETINGLGIEPVMLDLETISNIEYRLSRITYPSNGRAFAWWQDCALRGANFPVAK